MNDYLRLRREEMARNSMAHSVSLSMGPYVEKMFKNFEVAMRWTNQVKKINAAFEKDTITETPGEAEANEVGEKLQFAYQIVPTPESSVRSSHGALLAPVSNASSAVAPNGVINRRFSPT